MNVFTSQSEVNFSATIDSKGRVTIPARIRDRIGLEKGDKINLSLGSTNLIQKEVENYQEAIEFVQKFDSVRSFSFENDIVEVILNG